VPKRRPASAGSPRWNKPHSAAGVGDAAALEDAAVEEALRNLRRELETEDDQRTAMKKSRIVRLGFGTARQKTVPE
jgi:hypothetical protein